MSDRNPQVVNLSEKVHFGFVHKPKRELVCSTKRCASFFGPEACFLAATLPPVLPGSATPRTSEPPAQTRGYGCGGELVLAMLDLMDLIKQKPRRKL